MEGSVGGCAGDVDEAGRSGEGCDGEVCGVSDIDILGLGVGGDGADGESEFGAAGDGFAVGGFVNGECEDAGADFVCGYRFALGDGDDAVGAGEVESGRGGVVVGDDISGVDVDGEDGAVVSAGGEDVVGGRVGEGELGHDGDDAVAFGGDADFAGDGLGAAGGVDADAGGDLCGAEGHCEGEDAVLQSEFGGAGDEFHLDLEVCFAKVFAVFAEGSPPALGGDGEDRSDVEGVDDGHDEGFGVEVRGIDMGGDVCVDVCADGEHSEEGRVRGEEVDGMDSGAEGLGGLQHSGAGGGDSVGQGKGRDGGEGCGFGEDGGADGSDGCRSAAGGEGELDGGGRERADADDVVGGCAAAAGLDCDDVGSGGDAGDVVARGQAEFVAFNGENKGGAVVGRVVFAEGEGGREDGDDAVVSLGDGDGKGFGGECYLRRVGGVLAFAVFGKGEDDSVQDGDGFSSAADGVGRGVGGGGVGVGRGDDGAGFHFDNRAAGFGVVCGA